MTYVSASLRRKVYHRAESNCEYCLISEEFTVKRHEVDHVFAEKHGGNTVEANLCLSCAICNRYKGSDLCSIDPLTGDVVTLFHPRRDTWLEHFKLIGSMIEGVTPQGRVTVKMLHFNDTERLRERSILIRLGKYP